MRWYGGWYPFVDHIEFVNDDSKLEILESFDSKSRILKVSKISILVADVLEGHERV